MINTNDCWLYAGYKDTQGYGRIFYTVNGNTEYEYAHRVSYRTTNGDMGERLVTDHLCSVRHCINPDHLEAVTARENTLRGNGVKANQQKTHCPQGHEYTKENTQRFGKYTWRRCRQCAIKRHRSYRLRKKAKSITCASKQ